MRHFTMMFVFLVLATGVSAQDDRPNPQLLSELSSQCEHELEEGEYLIKWYAKTWDTQHHFTSSPSLVMNHARNSCFTGCMVMFKSHAPGSYLQDLWAKHVDTITCPDSRHDFRLVLLVPRNDGVSMDTISFTRGGCMLVGKQHHRVEVELLTRLTLVLPYEVSVTLRRHLSEHYGINKFDQRD